MTDATFDAFRALSDPTRRTLLDLLMEGPKVVKELLEHFDCSQPAISQHLRTLLEAGLVTATSEGRQRRYHIRGEGIKPVADWVEPYQKLWQGKLDALGQLLDGMEEVE